VGNRGFNAGGFRYMPRLPCRVCGRRFPIGNASRRRTCARCQREGLEQVYISEKEARAESAEYWRTFRKAANR